MSNTQKQMEGKYPYPTNTSGQFAIDVFDLVHEINTKIDSLKELSFNTGPQSLWNSDSTVFKYDTDLRDIKDAIRMLERKMIQSARTQGTWNTVPPAAEISRLIADKEQS